MFYTSKKRIILHSAILILAINVGLMNSIQRSIDPTIPINKTTNTFGILLFLLWLVLPLLLGWVGKKSKGKAIRLTPRKLG